jgi:hypothetical protein
MLSTDNLSVNADLFIDYLDTVFDDVNRIIPKGVILVGDFIARKPGGGLLIAVMH